MSTRFSPQVLLATARILAALNILPCIDGPKKAWIEWFRNALTDETMKIPWPTLASPQPRLIGSLHRILRLHYSSGMILDTLDFNEVRWDDDSVADNLYVDIPLDSMLRR